MAPMRAPAVVVTAPGASGRGFYGRRERGGRLSVGRAQRRGGYRWWARTIGHPVSGGSTRGAVAFNLLGAGQRLRPWDRPQPAQILR